MPQCLQLRCIAWHKSSSSCVSFGHIKWVISLSYYCTPFKTWSKWAKATPFYGIVNFVQPFLDKVYHGGCPPVCCKEMIYMTLVYLANQGAVRQIGNKFGRFESAYCNCVHVVRKVLSENQSKFIEWPTANYGGTQRPPSRKLTRLFPQKLRLHPLFPQK